MDWQSLFANRALRMQASEIRELLKLLDQPDVISFAGGIPDPSLFPNDKFSKIMSDILSDERHEAALQYSVSEGYLPLREWLADHMATLGVACDASNIMITSGSQQALDYLGKLFLSPNDTALVTWPTYLGALQAFNAYEPQYDQLNPNNSNRDAGSYIEAAKSHGGRVKFLYASVDFANPTGETLDGGAREHILNLASGLGAAVIEDAAYQSLRYEGEVLPPILAQELANGKTIDDARTIYCGSFSKTLVPGLRVGWVCAARDVIDKLVLIKQASDLHSPSLNQMAVNEIIRDGFDAHIDHLRRIYGARRKQMLKALSEFMPDGVTWSEPDGGMFVWLTLPPHIDGAKLLAESLKQERVAFVPGTAFFADGSGQNTIRLNFSRPDQDMIVQGIQRLARVISNYG